MSRARLIKELLGMELIPLGTGSEVVIPLTLLHILTDRIDRLEVIVTTITRLIEQNPNLGLECANGDSDIEVLRILIRDLEVIDE